MALLDKVPGELNVYIGGLISLRRAEALKNSNITHVLSVLRLPLEDKLFEGFRHLIVEVDDVDDENLLEHFAATNRFIQDGLDAGGGVLVHCAMGKSRSATCVVAYLMKKYGVSPTEALAQIRESRPFCEPNEGFMRQLELYHEMHTPENVEETPVYQRWLYQRVVELSRACGQAPEPEKIRFEDEHASGSAAAEFELRCRKCRLVCFARSRVLADQARRPLAKSQYVLSHSSKRQPDSVLAAAAASTASKYAECAHYFLDPLSWMRPELEQGKLDGRLECPKCKTNVGKYAWQGMQCSCGDWVVPAISLARGRIDAAKRTTSISGVGGIRMPPMPGGRNRPLGQENL